jgi:hypothetical protein
MKFAWNSSLTLAQMSDRLREVAGVRGQQSAQQRMGPGPRHHRTRQNDDALAGETLAFLGARGTRRRVARVLGG